MSTVTLDKRMSRKLNNQTTKGVKNESVKSTTINMRIDQKRKALIEEAARSKHLDRSSFILEAAYKAAEETILDQRLIFLGDEDFNNLNRDLSVESLETNKCLQKFLNQEPNWQ